MVNQLHSSSFLFCRVIVLSATQEISHKTVDKLLEHELSLSLSLLTSMHYITLICDENAQS